MINITDKAKAKMISVMDEESATILRFGLQGGGCNGFSYFFAVPFIQVSYPRAVQRDPLLHMSFHHRSCQ